MMRNTYPTFWLALCLVFLGACAKGKAEERYYSPEDQAIFARYLSTMQAKKDLPTDQLIVEAALFFLGTPYVGATLEKEPEGLVINLREMDCSTFVENVISLTQTLQSEDPSFDTFCRNLQHLRYREGRITDYTDRLHYTSDWIYVNAHKGLVKDVTKEIGGKPLDLNLSFMSTHPESYKQLNGNPERIARIEAKEKEISARSYFYIPEEEIDARSREIKNGDMIGFVTTINGLDLSHVGIAYWQNDELTFIHASSSAAKQVIINKESLSAYVKRIKSNKGVMIVRLLP